MLSASNGNITDLVGCWLSLGSVVLCQIQRMDSCHVCVQYCMPKTGIWNYGDIISSIEALRKAYRNGDNFSAYMLFGMTWNQHNSTDFVLFDIAFFSSKVIIHFWVIEARSLGEKKLVI